MYYHSPRIVKPSHTPKRSGRSITSLSKRKNGENLNHKRARNKTIWPHVCRQQHALPPRRAPFLALVVHKRAGPDDNPPTSDFCVHRVDFGAAQLERGETPTAVGLAQLATFVAGADSEDGAVDIGDRRCRGGEGAAAAALDSEGREAGCTAAAGDDDFLRALRDAGCRR